VNFLNLGLGELLGLIGAVSAGVTVLYLLDRSNRRHLVSTLRFWTPAGSRTELKHRRRIQQPWSLLLQLLSLILLLLAIAGPQFGVFDGPGRTHVVILDTSAWMGSLTAQGTLQDEAKANARAYVSTLPSRDRVMLVRAEAIATPLTAFETDRNVIEAALREAQPGASALNLSRAFTFAERAQRLQGEASGEIAFVGAGRVLPEETGLAGIPKNLRIIASKPPGTNVGFRKLSMKRSRTAPDTWEIFAAVHNYDSQPRVVDLEVRYTQAPVGSRRISIAPGTDAQAAFTYREKVGGQLEARLNIDDSFPQDDRAVLEATSQKRFRTIVYSNDALLRPLFASNPTLETELLPTSSYKPNAEVDLVVLDRFAPVERPNANAIWIDPPPSPVTLPVRSRITKAAIRNWDQRTSIGAGIYTQDILLDSAAVFTPADGNVVVASADAGPVIVARAGVHDEVLIGFHPGIGQMKYELTTPLLIANIVHWIFPNDRDAELQVQPVGSIQIPAPAGVDPASVHVISDEGELPFTIEGGQLRFFLGSPGDVSVTMNGEESLYSLSLPDLAEGSWKAPASVARGIPPKTFSQAAATEIWPWLAIAGALGLLADWILFGRNRALRLVPGALRKAA
jgi:hypothetical protein